VTPRAVVGVVLVGTVVAAVLLVRLLLVQHQARPVPLRMAATGSAGGPAPSPPAGTSPALSGSGATAPGASSVPGAPSSGSPTASAATATVLVHVVGEVRHAGVVRLPAGARVEQALDAAGGATAKADLVRVNLARVVVDGEQIVVPRPGQVVAGAPAAGGPSAVPGAAGGTVGTVLDLNTAGLTELDALPGVGPVLAQRILDWRSENGRFTSVDELGEVSGIGDKVLDRLRALVRV
jgi:competence protein ComEA